MEASRNGHEECVKALIECGANLDIQDDNGETALMAAARKGDVECVKVLTRAGANPDIQDNEGKTALDYAKTDEIRKLLQGEN